MNHKNRYVAILLGFWTFALCTNQVSAYAGKRVKVAVLPVNVHSAEKAEYLQSGLMEMLTSRIGGEGTVEILDSRTVQKAFKRYKTDLNEATARALADDVGADYVLSSSITLFGAGGSIDFRAFSSDARQPAHKMYEIVNDRNEIIPTFSRMVEKINKNILATVPRVASVQPKPQTQPPLPPQAPPPVTPKSIEPAQQVPTPQPPQVPAPSAVKPASPKMANIKQEVIHQRPVRSEIRQPASAAVPLAPQASPWRSQEVEHTLVSMDVGDLFGDGLQRVAAISRHRVFVYGYSAGKLEPLAELPAASENRLVWVSVADLNRNGRDEIFVTAQKRLSNTRMIPSSFVLEWDGERFVFLSDNLHYYLRAMRVPGEPARLLGQKSADNGSLLPEIHKLVWNNNTLTAVGVVSAPESANIYNSTSGDVTGQGERETVMISPKRYLLLTDSLGQPLWRSTEAYATTENSIRLEIPAKDIPQPVDDLRGDAGRFPSMESEGVEYIYLPSPVLLTDLDQDNRLEVIVTRNLPGLGQLTGSRHYGKGEILSLTWGGTGMLENWKTDEIKGEINSLQVGDLNGDGAEELVVCITESNGISGLWAGKTSIIMSNALGLR